MQNRHPLEQSLTLAINSGDISYKDIIQLINKYSNASLASHDSEGKTFLFQAIEKEQILISKDLFFLQSNNEEVLFKKDNKGLTLLHIAALHSNTFMIDALFNFAVVLNKLGFYMEGDDDGNTVLHQAVLSNNSTTVEFLIKKIPSVFLEKIINTVNKNGDTPLHKAFSCFANKSIAYLINANANLCYINNLKQMPIVLLAKLDLTSLEEIFGFIHKEKQKNILDAFRQLLLKDSVIEKLKKKHSVLFKHKEVRHFLFDQHNFSKVLHDYVLSFDELEIENLKAKYLKLSGHHTLQTSLYAQGEFNKNLKFSINTDKQVLRHMPLYVLHNMLYLLPEASQQRNTSLLLEENDYENQSTDDALNADRLTVTALIQDIETFMNDLRNRPVVTNKTRASILLTCIIPAIAISIFIYACIHWDGVKLYSTMGIAFSLIILGCMSTAHVRSRADMISYDEWKFIVDRLQKDVLTKLQCLEEYEKNDTAKYLPTSVDNIRSMESDINGLQKGFELSCYGKIYDAQAKSEIIDVFSRINSILKTLREEMNLVKKPLSFTLFKEPPAQDRNDKKDVEIEMNGYESLLPPEEGISFSF